MGLLCGVNTVIHFVKQKQVFLTGSLKTSLFQEIQFIYYCRLNYYFGYCTTRFFSSSFSLKCLVNLSFHYQSFQAIFVWELVANGLDLDRIGKSEVFGVLDKIGEFFDNLDLAGNSLFKHNFKPHET